MTQGLTHRTPQLTQSLSSPAKRRHERKEQCRSSQVPSSGTLPTQLLPTSFPIKEDLGTEEKRVV